MKKFTILALWLLCHCVTAEEAPAQWLRWASDPESGAPFAFHDEHSMIRGIDVDLVEAIAKKMGYKPAFFKNDWDGLIPGLQRKLYDIVVDGIELTAEHSEAVDFSIPYYITHLQLVVRSDNTTIQCFDDCKGKVIGTLKSSTAYAMLKALKNVDIKTYTDEVHAYTDLKLGRIDGAFFDAPIALYYASWDPNFKFIDQNIGTLRYAVAVRRGDQVTLNKINAAIDALIREGTLREILERWNLWNDRMAEYTGDSSPSQVQPEAYDAFVKHISKTFTFRERFERYMSFLPALGRAAMRTMEISLIAMAIAIFVGFIAAILRVYGPRPISVLTTIYVEIVRGTPLMIQLLLIFYGLPLLQIKLSPIVAGVIGLGINYSAYEAENYRAGLFAVHRGQMEAALALGMTPTQGLWHVVMPQAFRFVLPSVTNDFISLLKDSSLVSLITITELTKAYTQIATTYYDYLGTGLLVAAIYLLLGLPFVRLARWTEKRLSPQRRYRPVKSKMKPRRSSL